MVLIFIMGKLIALVRSVFWILFIGELLPLGHSQFGGETRSSWDAVRPKGACGSIDVRNRVENLRKIANCTVIEGELHILLIDYGKEEEYEEYSFPDLVEITDHLLLYRVYGLRSLRTLFPNLAVIRGQKLFVDFALIAYEMPDMVELGLVSLTSIPRGGVRLEKNKELCYIDTIDWSKIATGVPVEDNFIMDNKDIKECVNRCPKNCDMTMGYDRKVPRCWTLYDCQKMLSCPTNCESGICNGSICCDKNCLGGCSGSSAMQCTACKDVIQYNDPSTQTQPICAPRCSPQTYKFKDRRCLLDTQCTNFTDYKSPQNKLVDYGAQDGYTNDGLCVNKCPTGYMDEEEPIPKKCIPCPGKCPKVCIGMVVDSIDSVQGLKGCTKIKGPLEINIMGGSHVGKELEENLATIEEVTDYIRIYHSYALISLHFFKNLKKIGGENKYQSRYSLVVFDNLNLQELFLDEVAEHLILENGTVWFQYNRKLCYKNIVQFIKTINHQDKMKPEDISEDTNGDQAACDIHKLTFSVMKVTPHIAILRWTTYRGVDPRQLISYSVNYKEAPDPGQNISIFTGRDACSDDIWKTSEVRPDPDTNATLIHNFITGLQPWTQYAAYVKTLTISKAVTGAVSEVITFRTAAEVPTSPTNLVVQSELPGELRITWDPPNKPNGNVTHYQVYWQLHTLDPDEYELRDYCDDPIMSSISQQQREEEEKEKEKNATLSDKCCACPKTEEEKQKIERERTLEIRFQDFLQNEVYLKRLDRPATTIRPNRSRHGARRRRMDNNPVPHEKNKYSYEPSSPVNPSMNLSTLPPTVATTTTTISTTTKPKASMPPKENPYFKAYVYGKRDLVIPNLGHFQDYNIEVIACQEKDPRDPERAMLCSNRALGLGRTLPDHKMDTINSSYVTASLIQNKTVSVRLQWKDPQSPNGLLLTYEISYRKTNINNIKPVVICIPHKRFREYKNGTIIDNLSSGNYTFRIRAISLAGNGSWTEDLYFNIPEKPSTETPTETIVGVVVAVLFVIIIITIVIVWYFAKRRYKKGLDTVVSTNPDYVRDYAEYEPDEWEVDRDNVELIRELGQGSFGMVYEGLVQNLVSGFDVVKVAIKTTNTNSNDYERYMFLQEASIMKAFHCHHVVRLMGVVSKGQPALVLMELMANGDLKNFLRMHRPDEEDNDGRQPPTLKQILQIAGEIADGMAYLADKKYVHRDLAARNCMVGEDMTVKIGDFGMTRDIYETDYYRKGNRGLLPVRWMAPESLKDGVFTSMSDVWSYGIVLWEMATLAAQPYQGLSNEEVLRYVGSGKIMDTPERCPAKLYDLMVKCWRFRPKNRPTFKELIEILLPELDKKFQEVSYFFSDENAKYEEQKHHGGGASNNLLLTANTEATPPAVTVTKTLPPKVEDLEMIDTGDDENINPLNDYVDEEHLPMLGAGASNGHSVELNDIFTDTGPYPHYSSAQKHSNSMEGCDCVVVREVDERGAAGQSADYNRQSVCSSPNSAIGGSSDGSKDSSKSSSSSYAHMNGVSVANGHGPVHVRTTPC